MLYENSDDALTYFPFFGFQILWICYRIYSLISRSFLPGIWPVFCLRLIRATYPEGQSFRMSYSLDGIENDILWTDGPDDTHDTDEDDTYDDLLYLYMNFLFPTKKIS